MLATCTTSKHGQTARINASSGEDEVDMLGGGELCDSMSMKHFSGSFDGSMLACIYTWP